MNSIHSNLLQLKDFLQQERVSLFGQIFIFGRRKKISEQITYKLFFQAASFGDLLLNKIINNNRNLLFHLMSLILQENENRPKERYTPLLLNMCTFWVATRKLMGWNGTKPVAVDVWGRLCGESIRVSELDNLLTSVNQESNNPWEPA